MDDNSLSFAVEQWKTKVRILYSVPEEYEIIMNYGQDNEINSWIQFCEEKHAIIVKNKVGRYFWYEDNGNLSPVISYEEHMLSLRSNYRQSQNKQEMTQDEANIIGHFLQLVVVIQQSSWYKYPAKYQENMNGDGKRRGNMPNLEQTVLALVYFRQLLDNNDNVLISAINTYKKYSENQEKNEYIDKLRKSVDALFNREPHFEAIQKYIKNYRYLFDVFVYGSLIIHNPSKIKRPELCNTFKKFYETDELKLKSVFELNFLLKNLLSPISMVSVLIQNDFGQWISEGVIPCPNIMWQLNLFKWLPIVEEDNRIPSNGNFDESFSININ